MRVTLTAIALLIAGPAFAQGPQSAIPWLSDSLERPVAPLPGSTSGDVILGSGEITVESIDTVNPNATGILPPEVTGFAAELWGDTPAETVLRLFKEHPQHVHPAAQKLFRRILLAESAAPHGSDGNADILLARIDRLLEQGALDEAGALLERADPDGPDLFLRWFDIGLLTNDADAPCEELRRMPSLSPTLSARIFCLARGGDWNAAEITLTMGHEIGSITKEQEVQLGWFLDPEIFEGSPPPPVPEPLTPLDFLMRESVGLPRPPGNLPLAFLHTDLHPHVPMRIRTEASERLALATTIRPAQLFDSYRSGVPAASGGIWDRAAAIQTLDAELDAPGNGAALSQALIDADKAMRARGLRVVFSQEYAEKLSNTAPGSLSGEAAVVAFELLLLAGEPDAAAKIQHAVDYSDAAMLLAIAGHSAVADPASNNPAVSAAYEAFSTTSLRPTERQGALRNLLQTGRQGEALLGALSILGRPSVQDPASFRAALTILHQAGQTTSARQIALEAILGGRI